MRSPLLRYEVRLMATRRIRRERSRMVAFVVFVSLAIFGGIGIGSVAAQAGAFSTTLVVALSAFIGWMLHNLTRPLV